MFKNDSIMCLVKNSIKCALVKKKQHYVKRKQATMLKRKLKKNNVNL